MSRIMIEVIVDPEHVTEAVQTLQSTLHELGHKFVCVVSK